MSPTGPIDLVERSISAWVEFDSDAGYGSSPIGVETVDPTTGLAGPANAARYDALSWSPCGSVDGNADAEEDDAELSQCERDFVPGGEFCGEEFETCSYKTSTCVSSGSGSGSGSSSSDSSSSPTPTSTPIRRILQPTN